MSAILTACANPPTSVLITLSPRVEGSMVVNSVLS